MNKETEHIIRNHRYIELNDHQLDLIHEFAANEEEYESLRVFLLHMQHMNAVNDTPAPTKVKQSLDSLFEKTYAQKRLVWYNALWAFLWPQEMSLYRRPLVQFASLVLLISLGVSVLPDLKQNQLAVNETPPQLKVEIQESAEDALTEANLKGDSPEADALVAPIEDKLLNEPVALNEDAKISQDGWQYTGGNVLPTTPVPSSFEGYAQRDDHDSEISFSAPGSRQLEVAEEQFNVGAASERGVAFKDSRDAPRAKKVAGNAQQLENLATSPQLLDLITALY